MSASAIVMMLGLLTGAASARDAMVVPADPAPPAAPRQPHRLRLVVEDAAGRPIPHATVSFPFEDDTVHPVNTVTGAAWWDAVYRGPKEVIPFRRGQVHAVDVHAEGYECQHRTVRLQRRRTHLVVTLLPAGATLDAG